MIILVYTKKIIICQTFSCKFIRSTFWLCHDRVLERSILFPFLNTNGESCPTCECRRSESLSTMESISLCTCSSSRNSSAVSTG